MNEASDFYIPDCCGGINDTDLETEIQKESSHENPIYDVIWEE